MKLAPGESVVTAWAERANGPGWSNQLVWVLINARNGGYRLDALQPEEWHKSQEFCALFSVSAVMAEDMTRAAKSLLKDRS